MTFKDNQKRNQILSTGKSLFWKYGIKRVTIEEISKEAGVSKMTFYKFFKNKNALVIGLMGVIRDESIARYDTIKSMDIPFSEKVKKAIELKMESAKDISMEFFNDVYSSTDPEIKEMMEDLAKERIQIIYDEYAEAQKNGDIRKDVDLRFIVYFLNHMMEMASDKKLLEIYKTPKDLVMELTNFFFYGVLDNAK